jgi:hypothetical protein
MKQSSASANVASYLPRRLDIAGESLVIDYESTLRMARPGAHSPIVRAPGGMGRSSMAGSAPAARHAQLLSSLTYTYSAGQRTPRRASPKRTREREGAIPPAGNLLKALSPASPAPPGRDPWWDHVAGSTPATGFRPHTPAGGAPRRYPLAPRTERPAYSRSPGDGDPTNTSTARFNAAQLGGRDTAAHQSGKRCLRGA